MISDAHLNEQQRLLKASQRTEIHCRQPTNSHGANAVEQRVDIRDFISPITDIENDRKEKRCEQADSG